MITQYSSMMHRRIIIKSEYSAQRRGHPQSPALDAAYNATLQMLNKGDYIDNIADLGCGKLRHYNYFIKRCHKLYLVDTKEQLHKRHVEYGTEYTVHDIVKQETRKGRFVSAVPFIDFMKLKLGLNAIFCVAVFDVVTRDIRRMIVKAASKNLNNEGLFVVIAPRNDYSILKRCTPEKAYRDGYVFAHHGINTFFHNFKRYGTIINDCRRHNLSLVSDISKYRQVSLIFRKITL